MPFTEWTIQMGDCRARVAPARGGLVTGLSVAGREVLYLDRATFEDESKNVRGGVPILFPFAGKLEGGLFQPAGTIMKQHGFARNRPWQVDAASDSLLTMSLESDSSTLEVFPYAFRLEQTCMVVVRGLEISLSVTNLAERLMPVAPGWHPYFVCPNAQKQAVTCEVRGINPADFAPEREFELGADSPVDQARFKIPELGLLTLRYSSQMRHLHFWSLPGADFICLEPFTGPLEAINHPLQRVEIAPGQTETFWMRIEVL